MSDFDHYVHPSGVRLTFDRDKDTWTEEFYPYTDADPKPFDWNQPAPKPDFWTSERYGIFLLTCSWAVAILLGYWWGS